MGRHRSEAMFKNVVVGGGVIGLSIAYELAKRNQQVVLLDRDEFGKKASWVGAGILPPVSAATAIHPMEHLAALSHRLHERWAAELLQRTAIDNGFRKCGGLYLARSAGEHASLTGMMAEWTERRIEFEQLDDVAMDQRFGVFANKDLIRSSIWVPGESQINNRHHLKALVAACCDLGVEMNESIGEARLVCDKSRVESVASPSGSFSGDNFIFASGPWTEQLIQPTNVKLPMQPVRGQIALYKVPPEIESTAKWPIVNEGSRYLVPRVDGHVLAGATIEEVGFDCMTTESEINGLREWAESLTDRLSDASFVKAWAGLRPATYDGLPYLGHLGNIENAFVATGHFKDGLHLSTGTAIVMADLIEGKTPSINLQPFNTLRATDHQSMDNR